MMKWEVLLKLKDVNKSDEILSLTYKSKDLVATTCALRIISLKLFEKIKLTELQKANINIEAFNNARKLMYETLFEIGKEALDKLVDSILERMNIYGRNDKHQIASAIFKMLEDSKENIQKEVKRITETLALDIENNVEELYVYARDLTLIYYTNIVTLALIFGQDEILILRLYDYYLDEYLSKNKIEI